MLTRWGASLDESKIHNDYPRPRMVRQHWQNLNGPWQYAITPLAAPRPDTWDGEIRVPFCAESQLSGVQRHVAPDQRLWYRRSFKVGDVSQRTLLHFEAIDHEAGVWINGAFVAAHRGGFSPVTLDISPFVSGASNELIVAVRDPSSAEDQPRGKQHLKPQGIWYTPVTGIWQTVWLEQVPREAHIEEVRLTPIEDSAGITISTFLARPTRDPTLALNIRISLHGAPVASRIARPDRAVTIHIDDPQRWSPSRPTLYDVDVSLVRVTDPLPQSDDPAARGLGHAVPQFGATEAGHYASAKPEGPVIDRVSTYFGLRHTVVGPHPASGQPTLLLNGEPLFQLGTLDQGWWPDGLHTPPSDDAMIYEIEFLRAAGFNTVRKHIKIEPARYYYHCDRLGILVWQDMPSGFLPAQFVAPNDEGEVLRSARSTQDYEVELQRMIHGLQSHPSIVMWVLHNEGWGQFDSERLTQRIKSLDPTRPVNATSGWLDMGAGDVIDRHDYQPEPTAPQGDGVRALVIGEYGGIGWPIEEHLWNPDVRNWGYQTYQNEHEVRQAYVRKTEGIIKLAQSANVCAAIYTQTSDVEGEVNGLLTYDRAREKLSREWLAKVHAPLFTGQPTE